MKNLKLTIIGNSVALRNRPPEMHPNNKNYGELLGELLQNKYPEKYISINNISYGRATMKDVMKLLDEYLRTFPHFFIINLGVCDAATREIPFWFAEILNKKNDSLIKKIFSSIQFRIIRNHRSFFVKLRGERPWISILQFENLYRKLVLELTKGTNAKLITMPINAGNDRIEKEIPGSRENYQWYNKVIEKLSQEY